VRSDEEEETTRARGGMRRRSKAGRCARMVLRFVCAVEATDCSSS
jgi:hypothetical protein